MRSLNPAPVIFVVAAACSAQSRELEHDTLTLKSGETWVGEVIEARDGKYWFRALSGEIRSAPFAEVERVVKATKTPVPVPVAVPSPRVFAIPEEARDSEEATPERFVGGGFDVGTVVAGRLRFRVPGKAVSSVDLRAGVGLGAAFSAGVGPEVFMEVQGIFVDGRVHPTLGVQTGVLVASSAFLVGGLNPGIQVDITKHVSLRGAMGVQIGLYPSSLGSLFSSPSVYGVLMPELGASFVW